jgi:pimeloyl-ACP methyl ester carboxylesterase
MRNLKTGNLTRRSFGGVALAITAAGMLARSARGKEKGKKAVRPPVGHALVATGNIEAGDLNIGYAELGPGDGSPVLLFHGWPYDINSFAEVAPLLADRGHRVIVPHLRGYGSTKFLSDAALRNGQQSALAVDAVNLMDALKIEKATVAGFDWGARTAGIVAALWPERCKGLVSVSGYLIGNQTAGKTPLPPSAELQWWYQFYFATDRGSEGYAKYTNDFAKLIWRLASPDWKFDDATFERSTAAFSNPDHVAIVVHNYRWRLGLTNGEKRFDKFETKLASAPDIHVPTITMEGDANGAPHPDSKAYASKFKAKYEHRLVSGGIGHNLPQEAPEAFAKAVIDVDSWA